MTTRILTALADRRSAVYAGALVGIVGVRVVAPASTVRALVVALLVGVMVVTYAGELWLAADEAVAQPLLVVPGVAGVVGGLWLVFTGTVPGLLFVAGGLLFVNRGIVGWRGRA
jgi:hypothetical protein